MELFLSKGYHGMSTTDICEGLGISRPTLYWYFRDKEDILFSVHKDRIESRIQPIVAGMKEIDDPLVRLDFFVREYARAVCLYPDTKALINETPYLAPEHLEWVREHWADALKSIRETIRELQEKGKAKELPELFVAFTLIGMVMWPYTWFDHSKPEGIDDLVDTIEEVFFSGILKPGISWRSHVFGSRASNGIAKREKRHVNNQAVGED